MVPWQQNFGKGFYQMLKQRSTILIDYAEEHNLIYTKNNNYKSCCSTFVEMTSKTHMII